MVKIPIREFGDPVLRKQASLLTANRIKSASTQKLIAKMKNILISNQIGVAIAAPQVGESVAVFVIAVRPTVHRPNVDIFDLIVINPEISRTFGKAKLMWEGCLSSGANEAGLFGKVRRYDKVSLKYLDEHAIQQTATFDGLVAQIIQHEVDHLNGVLFVDRVTDPTTFMTMSEYRKRITPTK